jgi:hypothetical protein
MKYIKLFSSIEKKQEFEQTVDYWPIVTLTKNGQETVDDLNYYDKEDVDSLNNPVKFPIYLETGTKTQIGADLYKYIIDNNIVGTIFNSETIIIYVDNVRVFAINIISDNSILLTNGGNVFDYLYPNGNLICACDI